VSFTGILSRKGIIDRLLTGETMICKWLKERRGEEIGKNEIKEIENLLDKCWKEKDDDKKEETLKEYFKKVKLNRQILQARRDAIKEYVRQVFWDKDEKMGKKKSDIENEIKGHLLEKYCLLKQKYGKIILPIFVDDFDFGCLRGANYDLRLGQDVYVTAEKVPKKLTAMGADGVVSIEPGEFGILMTHEYIFVPPDIIGFISVRLTFKQKGLVNISGFHVDPGFYGRLMFAVFNSGPNDVPLRYKERVFMIMFNELDKWARFEKSTWHGMETIPIETIFGLRGTSISLRNLDERVKRLELLFPAVLTGIIGVISAVIAWLITH